MSKRAVGPQGSSPAVIASRRDDRRDAVDMARDDMAAEFVADLERALEVDAACPACQSPTVVRARVSAAASTSNQQPSPRGSTATTVRHGPPQAIEAPSAIVAGS